MHQNDPTRMTQLSVATIAFLIVFLPGMSLVLLMILSYYFAPWT